MFDELVRRPGVLEQARLRSNVAFLALHGGSLERGTAEIATAAADRAGASLYAIVQPDDLRWHIPSHLADLDALPKLRAVLEHADVVVSLHGYGRPDLRDTLLLGGGNRELAATLAARLRRALPRVAGRRRPRGDPRQLRGACTPTTPSTGPGAAACRWSCRPGSATASATTSGRR